MKYYIITAILVLLTACGATTKQSSQPYNDLSISSGSDASIIRSHLNRFPPKYPLKEASSGVQGCATIEYVLTANRKITDVSVIDATNKNFAKEAKKVVTKWDWNSLGTNTFETPIKLQTRFEFCLDDGHGSCNISKLMKHSACSGEDVIGSIGYLFK